MLVCLSYAVNSNVHILATPYHFFSYTVTRSVPGSFSPNSPASPLSSASLTSPLSPFSPVPGSQASPTKQPGVEVRTRPIVGE